MFDVSSAETIKRGCRRSRQLDLNTLSSPFYVASLNITCHGLVKNINNKRGTDCMIFAGSVIFTSMIL